LGICVGSTPEFPSGLGLNLRTDNECKMIHCADTCSSKQARTFPTLFFLSKTQSSLYQHWTCKMEMLLLKTFTDNGRTLLFAVWLIHKNDIDIFIYIDIYLKFRSIYPSSFTLTLELEPTTQVSCFRFHTRCQFHQR